MHGSLVMHTEWLLKSGRMRSILCPIKDKPPEPVSLTLPLSRVFEERPLASRAGNTFYICNILRDRIWPRTCLHEPHHYNGILLHCVMSGKENKGATRLCFHLTHRGSRCLNLQLSMLKIVAVTYLMFAKGMKNLIEQQRARDLREISIYAAHASLFK